MNNTITTVATGINQAERNWSQLIDGTSQTGSGQRRTHYNPANGSVLCHTNDASTEQVINAIKAARKAFDQGDWSRTTAVDRSQILYKVADAIEKKAEELAVLETLNAGKPLRESRCDVADAANCFRYYAGLIRTPLGQTVDVPAPSVTQVVREPIGVCTQIIPWNYPLLMAAWKLAPALAAGNTCVLKPSEYTPLTALVLSELLNECGLPHGTVNIVTGDGPGVGQILAESSLVDKVAFTGSATTGKRIVEYALGNLKKVTLELGGKSPMLVFNDVDLDLAVDYALYAIFCHAGQVCSAGSRFIVQEDIYNKFLNKFVSRSSKIRVGPGLNEQTEMGPLISQIQLERVLNYINIGEQEGAKLVLGGGQPQGTAFGDGYYVNPTIFVDATVDMHIVQEEIFGPVAVVEKFTTEKEAIALANATRYGLAAAVFTNDVTRAYRVGKAIKAGVIWLNGYHSCYNEAPFGGYKESGWGRECGTFGLDAYTEVKQINLNLDPVPVNWFV